MRAINIEYDTDGEDIFIPQKMEIPKEIEDDEEKISDYITNETGFCHYGFDLVD